jgi:drug/metabolite transporter (DMT)-like permease
MWFYFALLSAVASAVGMVARRTNGSLAQPIELSWWSLLFSLPLSIIILLLDRSPRWTSHAFIGPTIVYVLINTITGVLYFRAYKYAEASAITPILNLLPVGLVITSPLILGTTTPAKGLIGILLIVAGVYYTSVNGKHSLLHPFKQMTRNKGSRAMLAIVVLWSISTNYQKLALNHASASFLVFVQIIAQFVIISIILGFHKRRHRKQHAERVLHAWGLQIALISFATTISVLFQMKASSLIANTSYVLAVKRLDSVLVVLYAAFFLKEHNIRRRLVGTLVAFIGIIFLFIFEK